MPDLREDEFAAFFAEAEPRLRRALVAAYGHERGREAACEALAVAWQRWEEVRSMGNPLGYLYRVGQSRSRPRRVPVVPAAPVRDGTPLVEPGLDAALMGLSERERTAVVLIEGLGWTFREVAEIVGLSVSSVQSYQQRGLRKLRVAMGVQIDG